MENEPNSTGDTHYKILRSQHVVFVVKDDNANSFFIALSANTSDEKALQVARETPDGEWRKLETIIFR
jgi:hypothetical protein